MVKSHLKHWQFYISEVIRGKKRGLIPSCLRPLLWLLSWPYRGAIALRNWAYDHELLKSHMAPIPLVISVGNIVAGGTGKTPVTQLLAQKLVASSKVAILSRGYRSEAEKLSNSQILSYGSGPLYSASQGGDEACLLARNVPTAIVIVGRNRYQSALIAAKEGAQVAVLDDGMQHRGLARHLEVIVVNASDPFGHDHFLPRGFLRESPKALCRANLIVINHVRDRIHYEVVCQQLAKYTNAPMVGMQMEVHHIYDIHGDTSSLKGKRVGVFCGIAHPQHFVQTVRELGAEPVAILALPDHAPMDNERLLDFAEECRAKGAEALVCTEKDQVKLEGDLPLPIIWVQMRLQIVAGEHHWEKFLASVRGKGP